MTATFADAVQLLWIACRVTDAGCLHFFGAVAKKGGCVMINIGKASRLFRIPPGKDCRASFLTYHSVNCGVI